MRVFELIAGGEARTLPVRSSLRRVEQPLFSYLDSKRQRFFEGFFGRISRAATSAVSPEYCLSQR